MKNVLVSIVMGVYNCEDMIQNCVESVIQQSYSNWELIICDDASTDSTYDIVNKYAQLEKRITLIRNKKNMRLASSLNNCLRIAKGKYIARLDADDEYTKDKLEKQVNFMEEHPEVDVTGTGRYLFDENGDYAIVCGEKEPSKEILLLDAPFVHPTIMMRREVYENLGGYTVSKDTMRCEDLDLWFRFYEQGYRGMNIQEPLYRYHLSRSDYKKRSLSAAIGTTKVFISGYKRLDIPRYKYIFALKPIVTALIPNKMMYKMHRNKFSKQFGEKK